jgi:hypothetical protein
VGVLGVKAPVVVSISNTPSESPEFAYKISVRLASEASPGTAASDAASASPTEASGAPFEEELALAVLEAVLPVPESIPVEVDPVEVELLEVPEGEVPELHPYVALNVRATSAQNALIILTHFASFIRLALQTSPIRRRADRGGRLALYHKNFDRGP